MRTRNRRIFRAFAKWGVGKVTETAGAVRKERGHIVLDCPPDWAEGCRLIVEPLPTEEKFGLTEEEWPRDPEAMAGWDKWFDAFEPVELTPEEEAKTPAEPPLPG